MIQRRHYKSQEIQVDAVTQSNCEQSQINLVTEEFHLEKTNIVAEINNNEYIDKLDGSHWVESRLEEGTKKVMKSADSILPKDTKTTAS